MQLAVGQPIVAAAGFQPAGRWKGGCGQDCPPHKQAELRPQTTSSRPVQMEDPARSCASPGPLQPSLGCKSISVTRYSAGWASQVLTTRARYVTVPRFPMSA